MTTTESTTVPTQELKALVRRLEVLEVKEAIRDVLHRYARGADRADIELFKSCYHPDATDCHWFYNGNAHEFADWVIAFLRQLPNSQHSITNPIIELDGDRAFVESQWYVLHRIPLDDGRVIDQQVEGRYLDVFERREGEWRILHRETSREASREHVVPAATASGSTANDKAWGKRHPHDRAYLGQGILNEPFEKVLGSDLWTAVRERNRNR